MANKRRPTPKKTVGILSPSRPYYTDKYRTYLSQNQIQKIQDIQNRESNLIYLAKVLSPISIATATTFTPIGASYALSQVHLNNLPWYSRVANWYRSQPFAQMYYNNIYNVSPDEVPLNKLYAGDMLHHALVSMEVNGPAPISWVQPSTTFSPFLINPEGKTLVISGKQIKRDLEYWKAVIDKENYPGFFDTIKEELIDKGIIIKDGVPYINDRSLTRRLAQKARIVQKIINLGERKQISQPWLAYRTRLTGEYHPGSYRESFTAIFGKSDISIVKDWTKSVFRSYNLRYFRLMDDPLEFMSQIMGIETGVEKTSLYKAFKNKFGVGGAEYYGRPLLELYGRHLSKVTTNLLIPYLGLRTLHETIKDIPFPGNAGLMTPLLPVLAGLDLARATIGTPFRMFANMLDALAPGTSSLGVAIGNVMQVGLTMWTGASLWNKLRSTNIWVSVFNSLDEVIHIPNVIKKISEPINKFDYFAYKVYKSQIQIPESISKFAPEWLENIIPKFLKEGKFTRAGKAGILAAGVTLGLSTLNIVGGIARLLGGSKSPSEWIQEYTGKKHVNIYKTRGWFFGQQNIFGEGTNYVGENWFLRQIHDYRGKTLWNKGEPGFFRAVKSIPVLQDIIQPYYLEQSHYYDMPYPITGPSQSFPTFFGPIYASTIGQLFKPTKYMHIQQWAYTQQQLQQKLGQQTLQVSNQVLQMQNQQIVQGTVNQSSASIGAYTRAQELTPQLPYTQSVIRSRPGKGMGPAISPYSFAVTSAQTLNAFQEAIGLPGYTSRFIIGDPQKWYTQYTELDNASELNSISTQFYYQNIGDPFGVDEGWRRMIVNQNAKRKQFDYLRNTQPSWMPDSSFYIKMKHGDVFKDVFEGYARVPGPGLTLRTDYSYLSNIPYENYPLADKLKILADLAPTSEEFKETYALALTTLDRQVIKDPKLESAISEMKEDYIQKIVGQKHFIDYGDKSPGIFGFQNWLNRLVLPTSELMLMSPKEKFSTFETPIDSYKHRVIQGNDSAIWSYPWRDFIRPFIGRTIGLFTDAPMPWVKKHRINNLYFDYLKYFKYSLAAKSAMDRQDVKAADKFKMIASQTSVAVNPYKSLFELYPALPKEERPYFIAFASETNKARRRKILEMTSPTMRRIYRARWELLDYVNHAENAPDKATLQRHIVQASKREEDLFNTQIIKEARLMEESYGSAYALPAAGWEGYTMQHSMTELKVGFLESIGEDPIDYRIPSKEIQMLNATTNPQDIYDPNKLDTGPDMLNNTYAINETLLKEIKDIIYLKSKGNTLPSHVYTLEYKPKVKYVWSRDN